MPHILRYHPATDLGRKFPHWVIATFRTREAAEAVRHECANRDSIVIIEEPNDPIPQRETAKLGPQMNGPGNAELVPPAGALTTNKESPNG